MGDVPPRARCSRALVLPLSKRPSEDFARGTSPVPCHPPEPEEGQRRGRDSRALGEIRDRSPSLLPGNLLLDGIPVPAKRPRNPAFRHDALARALPRSLPAIRARLSLPDGSRRSERSGSSPWPRARLFTVERDALLDVPGSSPLDRPRADLRRGPSHGIVAPRGETPVHLPRAPGRALRRVWARAVARHSRWN